MAISIPETQNAAVVEKPGKDAKAVVKQLPVEDPKEGEVLIKMEATGVCHTDLHLQRDDWNPAMTMTCPVGGHEGVGRIVKLGPGVDNLKLYRIYHDQSNGSGQMVGIKAVWKVCGKCDECKAGEDALCSDALSSGAHKNGTFQEYAIGPASYVTPVPEGVDPLIAAPLMCGGVTAYKALKVSGANRGDYVVLLGAGGGLGSFALQFARIMGFRTIAVDGGAAKAEATKSLGAETYIDFTKEDDLPGAIKKATGGGAHAVIVFSPSPKAYAQAAFMLRKRGTMVAVGLPAGSSPITVEPGYLAFFAITLRGSLVGNQKDVIEALELAKKGEIKVPATIKKLADLQSVMEDMEAGKVIGRVVLTFD